MLCSEEFYGSALRGRPAGLDGALQGRPWSLNARSCIAVPEGQICGSWWCPAGQTFRPECHALRSFMAVPRGADLRVLMMPCRADNAMLWGVLWQCPEGQTCGSWWCPAAGPLGLNAMLWGVLWQYQQENKTNQKNKKDDNNNNKCKKKKYFTLHDK